MRRFFLHSWALGWFLSLAACSSKQVGKAVPPPSESRAADEMSISKHVDSVESDKAAHVGNAAPPGMVLIPGGPFFMGVDKSERGIEPGHMTDVVSFAIDRTEVSVADYLECQQSRKCAPDLHRESGCNAVQASARAAHPMNCVTWHEANQFCVAHGKRLPTSTEWELAARGTDRRPYPWGSALPAEQLCWQGRKGEARSTTCPVGNFPQGASPYGVLDMSGNVAEWTSTVAEGAYPPPIYVVRGGDYSLDPLEDRQWSFRRVDMGGSGSGNPNLAQVNVGFRCAADLRK